MGRRASPAAARYLLPAARLPAGVDRLDILLVSDLHVGGRPHPSLAALDRLAGARPDLLIAAGDLVESERFIPDVGERLARIEARLGAFAVWGNHGLAAHGVQTLTNRAVRLTVNDARLQLVGVGDTHVGLCDLDAAFEDTDAGLYTILAAHNPDTVFELGARRVDLTLGGHTHGGQIALPVFGPLTLRTRHPLPRPCGLMYVQGRPLIVSAGVGTAGVPVRFNAPADVTTIRLVRVQA